MNFLLWGITLGTIGKLVLGIAVLRVHIRILEEHRIDGVVLSVIKREHWITLLALLLILIGYLMEISFYRGSTNLLSCVGASCASAIQAAFTK